MLKKPLPLAALFILTNALYFWMASRTLPALMAFAGGLPPLDALPFGYAPDYPARLFAAFSQHQVTECVDVTRPDCAS